MIFDEDGILNIRSKTSQTWKMVMKFKMSEENGSMMAARSDEYPKVQ